MMLVAKKTSQPFKKEDTVILFLAEQGRVELKKALPGALSYIERRLNLSFFKGKQAELMFFPFADHPAIILCGMGKKEEIDAESLRRSAASAVALCRERSIDRINVMLPEIPGIDDGRVLTSITEGMYLANYGFYRYKTKKNDNGKPLIRSVTFHTKLINAASILKRVEIISRNTLLCRDLINETSEKSDSLGIARKARAMGKIPGVTCTIYGKKDIEKMKMGLLLAVSRGSAKPPHLVVLKYRGNRRSRRFIALVGKGITFDSGGINLKPSGHIEDMRTDMAGAAVVMYALKTAAELKLPRNLYAVLPLTENMLSNESYRPGDVFTAYNGTTVEIGNTDAEGRLILADALAFTEKKLKPYWIIDLATLTGACLTTFGELVAGYVTTDDRLGKSLEDAGAATGELIWKLPLFKDYEENVKSDIADICNVSAERNAGTIMGGIFLKNFVKTKRWTHIDIASTARATKQRGYRPKNATGFGVRLLAEAITNWKD